MDRRTLLLTIGLVFTAGCSTNTGVGITEPSQTRGESPTETSASTGNPTATPTDLPTPTPGREFPGGVFRCQGDSVSVEQSLPEDEKPAAYFPSNETIAYPALVSGDNIVEYDTMSFERWRIIQTAETAQGAVLTAVQNRVGTEVGSGLTRAPNADGPSLCVWLFVPDSDAIEGTPPVTLHELVEQAPQSADVTLTLEEEMFSRTHISREVPVFAEH